MKAIEFIRTLATKELGIENLPPEVQGEALQILSENIITAVTIAALENLPADKQSEFAQLSERGDAEGMIALLRTHMPNADAVISKAAQDEVATMRTLLSVKLASAV